MTSPLQQKIKITGPSVVTANRTSDEARALLSESVADDVGAIGAYIAPVEVRDSGAIKPGNLREHIRLQGVTIELPVPA